LGALLQVQACHGGAALLDLQSRGTEALVHAKSSRFTRFSVAVPIGLIGPIGVGPCGR
jgi:hypothetical protein